MAEPSHGFDNVSKAAMTQHQEADSMKSLAGEIWAKGSDMSKGMGGGSGNVCGSDALPPDFPKLPGQAGGVPATDVVASPPAKPIVMDGAPWPTQGGNHLQSIIRGDEPKGDPRYQGADTFPTPDPRGKLPPDVPTPDHHDKLPTEFPAPGPDPKQPTDFKSPGPDPKQPTDFKSPGPDPKQPTDFKSPGPDPKQPTDFKSPGPDPKQPTDFKSHGPDPKQPTGLKSPDHHNKLPLDKIPSQGAHSVGAIDEGASIEPRKTVTGEGSPKPETSITNGGGVVWDVPVPPPPGSTDAAPSKDPRLSDSTTGSSMHFSSLAEWAGKYASTLNHHNQHHRPDNPGSTTTDPRRDPPLGEGEGGYSGTLNHKKDQDPPLKPGDLTFRPPWIKHAEGEGEGGYTGTLGHHKHDHKPDKAEDSKYPDFWKETHDEGKPAYGDSQRAYRDLVANLGLSHTKPPKHKPTQSYIDDGLGQGLGNELSIPPLSYK